LSYFPTGMHTSGCWSVYHQERRRNNSTGNFFWSTWYYKSGLAL